MNLPFLKKKKEETGFYLALVLSDEKAAAVILHEELGKVKIIGSHEEPFSQPLDHVELDELIEVVDKALSRAEEVLPPSIETHDTIFGVKENWVDEETKKIKKQHLAQLKKVCDNLDLTPIGFMVTGEAVSHLIKEEEGAPLSAILAEVSKTHVTLTLLRGGKKLEAIRGPLKEFSAPVTVDTLLRHFTVPVLPARLILYDTQSRESLSQDFISHQWSKALPFQHIPQITVLPAGFSVKAVAFGAAAQMGFELVGLTKDHFKTITPEEATHQPHHPEHPEAHHAALAAHATAAEEDEEETEKPEETDTEEKKVPIEGDNFGFVTDKDISEVPQVAEKHHAPVHHKPHHEPEEPVQHAIAFQNHHEMEARDEEEDEEEEEHESRGHKTKASPLAFLSGLKLPSFKGGAFASMGKNKKILFPVIGVVALLLAIGALSFYYLYQSEATVTLTMKPTMANQTAKTVFAGNTTSNFDKNLIAAKTITVTVDGETSIPVTGKKDVGEKAKGTVTIFNNSSEKITISSGTEIKTSNNLVFVTDKEITVSSASGDIFSGTKPGTTNVSVVAKEIGSEQNMPSNTKFSVGGNSSLAAKNDSAFSGGTKKSVTVVSKEDHAKLRAELPKSLQSKAKAAIAQKAGSEETVLPFAATNSLESAVYDKKIDEEAKQVKLKAKVVFDGMSYSNEDLIEYAKSLLKKDEADDINFANNSVKAIVKDAKQDGDNITATVEIEGGVLPKIDTSEIATELQGKSYSDAQETLANLPQIAESQITFSPGIPFLPQIFPSLPKNIKVVAKSE